jgi:membrane associated rhomboid family serine protease
MIPIRHDNPARRLPVITVVIFLVNIATFLYGRLLGVSGFDVFTNSWAAIPFELTHGVDAISPTPLPVYSTLVTSLFMHEGLLHIASNMLYLLVFGNNIEDVLGHLSYLVFYLFCGVVATLAHVATDPDSFIPRVGASGAIAGVLGAYLAAFPSTRVHVYVPIFFFFRVPAALVLGLWFLVQLISAWMDSGSLGGGVAWHAHIGGFVVGYVLMRIKSRGFRQVEVF